jgi:hypothetical protein
VTESAVSHEWQCGKDVLRAAGRPAALTGAIHDWIERRVWEWYRQRDPIRHMELPGTSGSSLLRPPLVIPIERHDCCWSLSGIGLVGSGSVLLSRRLPVRRHSMRMRRCVSGSQMSPAIIGPRFLSHEEGRGSRVAATRDNSMSDDDKGVDLLQTDPEETCAVRPAASLRTTIPTSTSRRRTLSTNRPFKSGLSVGAVTSTTASPSRPAHILRRCLCSRVPGGPGLFPELDACVEFWNGLCGNDSCGTAYLHHSTLQSPFQTIPVPFPQGTSRVAVCPMRLIGAEGTLGPVGLGRARLGQRLDDQEGTHTCNTKQLESRDIPV